MLNLLLMFRLEWVFWLIVGVLVLLAFIALIALGRFLWRHRRVLGRRGLFSGPVVPDNASTESEPEPEPAEEPTLDESSKLESSFDSTSHSTTPPSSTPTPSVEEMLQQGGHSPTASVVLRRKTLNQESRSYSTPSDSSTPSQAEADHPPP
jgi:hypothetical protein